MNKLKLLLLSFLMGENQTISMYNPVPVIYPQANTTNNIANNIKDTDNANQKLEELFLYKLFTYGTFLGLLGLVVITFVNSFVDNTKTVNNVEESTQSILGLVLQLCLGVLSGLGICLKVGFECTFASILKLLIIVYGLVLGALSLAGEYLSVPFLAGLTANEKDTIPGLIIGYTDIGLSVIGLLMTIAYHYLTSTNSRYQTLR